MRRILFTFAAVTGILGSVRAADADPLAWPPVTTDAKPWTRWWWLGSAVDEPNLTRILDEFRQVGIGGVEITPIYGAKGSEDKFIDFRTPKWMRMLAHTTSEGKRLGIGIDMATGTGWPFGGPRVTREDASARVNMQKYDVSAGEGLKGNLPRGRLQCLMALSDSGQRIDLTSKASGGRLDWTAPDGKWKLYAVAIDGPVMQVKRSAPGGVGSVLDPFSVPALNRYLADFDKPFADFRAPRPRGQFHDSYEYYNAQWTPEFFAEFKKRRGYDLRDQLPALFGDGVSDTVARVKCDYRETLSDLHLDYIRRWTEWCHAHGEVSRNQAHGGPGNLIDTYAASDIPEMEIYRDYTTRQTPMMKLAASAAHLSGRKLVSAESFTWLGEHFQVSLAQCKGLVDNLFLTGVNHIFFHGIPYSPKDAPWPGWQFYAAVNFGPQGGLWRDLPAFNAYVTRCQSILQAGKPANDVLLYLPYYDRWQTSNGMVMVSETEGGWMESLRFHAAAMTLWNRGYGFDAVSDRMLAGASARDGAITVGGNPYRVVVVPAARVMPPATLKKLIDLARDGATVIFHGSLPEDVPGFGNLDERRGELKALRTAAEYFATLEKPQPGEARKGAFYFGPDLNTLLTSAKVIREPMTDAGLRFIRRTHDAGHHYFVVNTGTKSVDGWVTLGTAVKSAVLLDPTAADPTGVAALRTGSDGATQVYLQLQPGQSLVVRTLDRDSAGGRAWTYRRESTEPQPIAGKWTVEFIDGGPVLPAAFETTDLASWTKRDDAEAKRFAGTARYTLTFDRPAGAGDDWEFDLGKVCESARVKVNGQDLGTLFAAPFRVPIGKHLRPGANALEVEVTNLAANRIRDLDRRRVNWKYFYDANLASRRGRGVLDASNWPLFDSGLLGPVTLTPVKVLSPSRDSSP